MFKEIILFLIVLTSICINEDKMEFIRLFGSLGIAFYLMNKDFNFGYWLFTNMLFFVMLIYSAANMYSLSYFGLFDNRFITFNTVNTRFLFVGMYVLTMLNIYIYGASNSFRNQLKEKTGKFGEKGQIGMKGEEGTPSTCESGCGDDLCYRKMLANITLIYNDWCDKNNPSSKLAEDAHIKNVFIKNKCKKMCNSEPMKTMLAAKGAEKCYDYVFHAYKGGGKKPDGGTLSSQSLTYEDIENMKYTCGGMESNGRMKFKSMWRQWIELILDYKEGKNFLDSDDLTDNDFDYLLNDEEDIDQEELMETLSNGSNVNKKKFSPFDEIKKYDIWYWGSPKTARPTYKETEECEINKTQEPDLKRKNNNVYTPLFRSAVARQSYLNKGEMTDSHCNTIDIDVDRRLAGTDKIMVYRPNIFIDDNNEEYLPFGDVVYLGDENCHNKDESQMRPLITDPTNTLNTERDPDIGPQNVTELVYGKTNIVKPPKSYTKLYDSTRTRGNSIDSSGYSIWRPVPPEPENGEKYVCLGDILSNSNDHSSPSIDNMTCIKEKCLNKKITRKRAIWNSINKEDPSVSSCPSHNEYPHTNFKSDTNVHKYYKEDGNGEDSSVDNISIVKSDNNYFKTYLNKKGVNPINKVYDHEEYTLKEPDEAGSCLLEPEFIPRKSEFLFPEKFGKDYGIVKIYDE